MRLVKLQDLSNRQISTYELLTKFIFKGQNPIKFESKRLYHSGDRVFTVNASGDIIIYDCIKDGIYTEITSDGWEECNIDSAVQQSFENYIIEHKDELTQELIQAIEVSSLITPALKELFDKLAKDNGTYTYKFYDKSELKIVDNHTVELPITVNTETDELIVYIDRLNVSTLKPININGNQISCEDIDINENTNITISIFKKNDRDAKMIYTSMQDVVVEKIVVPTVVKAVEPKQLVTSYKLTFNIPKGIRDPYSNRIYKSMVFDLFNNGQYIYDNEFKYTFNDDYSVCTVIMEEKTGNRYGLSEGIDTVKSIITASLNKTIAISKTDIFTNTNISMGSRMIDLKYRDYNSITEWCNCYDNGRIIPGFATEIYNGIVHITDDKYNVTSGRFVLSYKTISKIQSKLEDENRSEEFQENIVVNQDVVRNDRAVVPYPHYNRNINNVMVFKTDENKESYISHTKYFINEDGYIQFYNGAISKNDVLFFQMLSDDKSISAYVKDYTFSQTDIDNGIKLPCLDFDKEMFDLIVFTEDGKYIPSERYSINENNWFTFNGEAPISIGTTLEFISMKYITLRTDTVIKRFRCKVKEANSLVLPFVYHGDTDRFFIASSTGNCIDGGKYTISTEGIIRNITDKPLFTLGENVDVFLCRELDDNPLITRIPTIRKNLTPTP